MDGSSDVYGLPSRSRAARGDRLTRLCHDLRQYIAACLRVVDEVNFDDRVDEALRYRVRILNEQLSAMSHIVTAENEAFRTPIVDIDVVDLVEESARIAANAARAEVDVEVASRPHVQAVRPQLQRALGNLLENACRASSSRRVKVTVDARGPYAVVEIEDDGAGFGLIARGGGHGLEQAQTALHSFGGQVSFTDAERGGTVARVLMPLSARSKVS